jgi:hypothetical protein
MDNNLIQLLLVLFFGGIATYDTIKSRKRDIVENRDKSIDKTLNSSLKIRF